MGNFLSNLYYLRGDLKSTSGSIRRHLTRVAETRIFEYYSPSGLTLRRLDLSSDAPQFPATPMNEKSQHRLVPKLWEILPELTRARLFADLIAGITVGLVALPLAMAFAISSGVKP